MQSDESSTSRSQVTRLIRGRRPKVVLLSATSLAGGLVEATFLVLVASAAFAITDGRNAVDFVGGSTVSIGWALALAGTLAAARGALAVWAAKQSARLTSTVVADMRRDLADAFLRASWSSQHGERVGRLQELLTTFVQQGATLVTAVVNSIGSTGSLVAMLGAAVVVDPLSSVVVVGVVAVFGTIVRPIRSAVKRQARKTAASSMAFATSLGEVSQLGMEMHVFMVQPQLSARVSGLIRHQQAMSERLTFLRLILPAVYTGLAYVAIVAALAVVSAADSASLASIGAVMVIMLRSLSYGQAIQNSIAAINAGSPFVDEFDREVHRYSAAGVADHGQAIGSVGTLELSGVTFSYGDGQPNVLRDLSATIEPCEVIGVIGPSGGGKSTLVQLMLGLRPPTSGSITAQGRSIETLARTEWARRVTFVPQQAHLIGGTIAENIRFYREDVTQEQIETAARQANLHDEVLAMDGGYDRQVGEQGSHLSGGQQQRLIIARALVERPDLLILDEPTSALDMRSEALIRGTLDVLRTSMTIVIIAHRLSTLDACDRIMVIQDGELKAFDAPAKLEMQSDFYRDSLALSGLR